MKEPDYIVEAKRWLQYAREDLSAAELILQNPTIAHRHVCWLAQQGTEKAIKGALIYSQIDFRRTHDLDVLLNLLPADFDIRQKFADLAELTEWAVESRYPGDWQEANEHDAHFAYEQAKEVLEIILAALRKQGMK
jgi:HEPN domain-containing protein